MYGARAWELAVVGAHLVGGDNEGEEHKNDDDREHRGVIWQEAAALSDRTSDTVSRKRVWEGGRPALRGP
jgi:hypothetical protein